MTFNTESLENGTESEGEDERGSRLLRDQKGRRDLCRREQEGGNGSKPRNGSIQRWRKRREKKVHQDECLNLQSKFFKNYICKEERKSPGWGDHPQTQNGKGFLSLPEMHEHMLAWSLRNAWLNWITWDFGKQWTNEEFKAMCQRSCPAYKVALSIWQNKWLPLGLSVKSKKQYWTNLSHGIIWVNKLESDFKSEIFYTHTSNRAVVKQGQIKNENLQNSVVYS